MATLRTHRIKEFIDPPEVALLTVSLKNSSVSDDCRQKCPILHLLDRPHRLINPAHAAPPVDKNVESVSIWRDMRAEHDKDLARQFNFLLLAERVEQHIHRLRVPLQPHVLQLIEQHDGILPSPRTSQPPDALGHRLHRDHPSAMHVRQQIPHPIDLPHLPQQVHHPVAGVRRVRVAAATRLRPLEEAQRGLPVVPEPAQQAVGDAAREPDFRALRPEGPDQVLDAPLARLEERALDPRRRCLLLRREDDAVGILIWACERR
uniref:Uncharacterized protein n=1 Tax=Arundo donax TaxID=35708 RepID=A0A0A9GK75_ARUDO